MATYNVQFVLTAKLAPPLKPVLAAVLYAVYHSRSARPPPHCNLRRFRRLPFGKLQLGKLSIGNCRPWENAFLKIPQTDKYIYSLVNRIDSLIEIQLERYKAMLAIMIFQRSGQLF